MGHKGHVQNIPKEISDVLHSFIFCYKNGNKPKGCTFVDLLDA